MCIYIYMYIHLNPHDVGLLLMPRSQVAEAQESQERRMLEFQQVGSDRGWVNKT